MLEDIKEGKKITSSMIRYCESEGNSELSELLRNSQPSSEEIDYDNWNGGTYIYAFLYEIEIDEFRKTRHMIETYEKALYDIAVLFLPDHGCELLDIATEHPYIRVRDVGSSRYVCLTDQFQTLAKKMMEQTG